MTDVFFNQSETAVLHALQERDGVKRKDLVEATGLTMSQVAYAMALLERKGAVRYEARKPCVHMYKTYFR